MDQTIDEQKFTLRWKVALPIMGFLLVVSNLFTRQITVIQENEKNIIENDEANRRRIRNATKVLKLELDNERLIRENGKQR